MEIRPATVDDAEAACDVLRRSIVELCHADHLGDPGKIKEWLANKTPENVRLWIATPGNCVLVTLIDGLIAGVAASADGSHVTLNYVAPEFRHRGVSKALLARLELHSQETGAKICTLKSTKTALAFYRSAGYTEGSPDGTIESSSIYGMAKRLQP
jgi:ribosomal protein S18 acetylase RimI-like enzyme